MSAAPASAPRTVGINFFAPAPPKKSGDTIVIWRENARSARFFERVRTQWRTSMGGVLGMDYPAIYATLDRVHRHLSVEERDAIFADIQVMELAALEAMNET